MLISKIQKSITYGISTIKQSLKVLQLNVPTTKTEIKKRYLLMAKKYHPDSAIDQKTEKAKLSKQKLAQIKKGLQQKFVNINKAYQYLKQYSQQQINTNKDKMGTNADGSRAANTTSQYNENKKAKMSTQQYKRHQTYQYFNRKFQQQNVDSQWMKNQRSDQNQMDIQRKPLYKSVPQLFVGFLLLAVMLGDYSYRVYKKKQADKLISGQKNGRRSQANSQQMIYKKQNISENNQRRERNPYKSMNHNMLFSREKSIQ